MCSDEKKKKNYGSKIFENPTMFSHRTRSVADANRTSHKNGITFFNFVTVSIFLAQDKVVKQAGQEAVDLGDGQHQIDVVDPAVVNPAKEVYGVRIL